MRSVRRAAVTVAVLVLIVTTRASGADALSTRIAQVDATAFPAVGVVLSVFGATGGPAHRGWSVRVVGVSSPSISWIRSMFFWSWWTFAS